MVKKKGPTDNGTWIAETIREFVATSVENTLNLPGGEKAFDAPLVGFANGADPLFAEYVSHIGDYYLTPLSAYNKSFPREKTIKAQELTVISWVLPSSNRTRREQAVAVKRPCERWVKVRFYGELFNDALRRFVVERLAAAGIPALAPVLEPWWGRSDTGPYAPCSNWSERHAAYAAGLGTFGLCDGLITPVGKAMRTGSVIARAPISASERAYSDHHAYCLFYSHGTCGKCISRCPVNAISEAGHDKNKCMQYTESKMKRYALETYVISISVCGLCQTGIPCTAHIPTPEEG